MKYAPLPLHVLFTLILFAAVSPSAWAEELLVERARAVSAQPNLPTRGQTFAQVEKKFGAPQEKLEPRGGQKRQWPVINRWVYPEFTVYFERQRVLNVVLNAGTRSGIGGTGSAESGWWDEQPAANTSDVTDLTPDADGNAWEQETVYAEDDDWSLPAQ